MMKTPRHHRRCYRLRLRGSMLPPDRSGLRFNLSQPQCAHLQAFATRLSTCLNEFFPTFQHSKLAPMLGFPYESRQTAVINAPRTANGVQVAVSNPIVAILQDNHL